VVRDQQAIHFRSAEPPTTDPDKYADELLDAYLLVENLTVGVNRADEGFSLWTVR
jgi:hypothetical protein